VWEIITNRNISWLDLENLQKELIQRVKKRPEESYLLVSEPLPTFTYGKTAQPSDFFWSKEQCEQKGIAIAAVARGGQWTYHGPGQVLCYPIASLEQLGFPQKGAKHFVEVLRSSVLNLCSFWNIPGVPSDHSYGVFVQGKKLASFGLSFAEGISSHGLALYVTPQETHFLGINPCGHSNLLFTCLQDYQPELPWNDAASTLLEFIKKGFKNL
jgi:lipoate-protein ligase B